MQEQGGKVKTMPSTKCPVCLTEIQPYDDKAPTAQINCPDCGTFSTTYDFRSDLRTASTEDRAYISGWIRARWRRGDRRITLKSYDIEPILKNGPRLSPA